MAHSNAEPRSIRLSFKRIKFSGSLPGLAPRSRRLWPGRLNLPITLMQHMPDGNETQLPRQTFEGCEPWGTGCLRKTKSTVCTEQGQRTAEARPGSCLPPDSRQDFWGPITSASCPHLSTSGSLLSFSTRKCKYQQKPIITSAFVFPDSSLSLSLVYLFILLHCLLPPKRQLEIILWLLGSITSLETNRLSHKQELPILFEEKNPKQNTASSSPQHVCGALPWVGTNVASEHRGERMEEGERGGGQGDSVADGPPSAGPRLSPGLGMGLGLPADNCYARRPTRWWQCSEACPCQHV